MCVFCFWESIVNKNLKVVFEKFDYVMFVDWYLEVFKYFEYFILDGVYLVFEGLRVLIKLIEECMNLEVKVESCL